MIRASQILFWFGLTLAAGTALYHTSDRTRALDRQLSAIDTSIENEQQTIHVLKAEWVYLANPARVETETRKNLPQLRPTAPQQVIALADLAGDLPIRGQATGPVAAAPAARAEPSMAALAPSPRPGIHKVSVAAVAGGHINDRIVIQHELADARPEDQIGALINELGSRR